VYMDHPVHCEGKLVRIHQGARGDDQQEDEVGIDELLPRREQCAQREASGFA
jgi:hypothetical protein